MHAAVLIHNLGLSQCSITLLDAAAHKVTNDIRHKIFMIEEGMKIRQSISQSTKGKGKRAQLRNHKQKLHDLKYDDPRDADIKLISTYHRQVVKNDMGVVQNDPSNT